MPSKSFTKRSPSQKKWKIKKCPQKALRLFSKKNEKLKNFLKKLYSSSREKKWKTQKFPQKVLQSFSRKSKKLENVLEVFYLLEYTGSEIFDLRFLDTVLLRKTRKLKNFPIKRYGPFGKKWKTDKCPQKALQSFSKKIKNWKTSSKSVTVLLERKWKTEKCPRSVMVLLEKTGKLKNVLLEKSEKVKNILKKNYDPFRKTVKNWKISSKRKNTEKLTNVFEMRSC